MMKYVLIFSALLFAVVIAAVSPVCASAPVSQQDSGDATARAPGKPTWEIPIAAGIWYPGQLVLSALYFFIVTGTNLPIILRGCSLIRETGWLGSVIPFQLFFTCYGVLLPFMGMTRKTCDN